MTEVADRAPNLVQGAIDKLYQLVFYVPESHLETVKQAVFAAGAGRLGNYEHCCWQIRGQGQFRALEGSNPFIGTVGDIQQLDEYRVEMVVIEPCWRQVIDALRQAHPYEEPAYSLWPLSS